MNKDQISTIRDNAKNGTVFDFLKDAIQENFNKYNDKSKLKIVSAYFTIYAFYALREELKNKVSEVKFILGEPSSVENLGLKNKRFKIFKIQDEDITLDNILQQNKGKMIRYPRNANEQFRKIFLFKDIYVQEYNKEPTSQEIAEAIGLSEERVVQLFNAPRCTLGLEDFSDSELNKLNNINSEAENINGIILFNELKERLENIFLKILSEKEIKIIKLRFGLEDGQQRTLEEIAEQYNVSRERIRQILVRVIRKLRKHKNELREFYNEIVVDS